MTLRLLLMATLACSCSGEPLLPVLEMMDLAEEHSFAEAAADEAQLELVRLSAELETARAGGARRADDLAELQIEVDAAAQHVAATEEHARNTALALKAVVARVTSHRLRERRSRGERVCIDAGSGTRNPCG